VKGYNGEQVESSWTCTIGTEVCEKCVLERKTEGDAKRERETER